ncbi:MAG: hypothetical protein J5685_03980 [Clostridiales bacterium]|nr:hypothetical protein [Clostridiales bacterium]
MRRDYFTCVFLACIAASLFFVWLLPLYFTYGLIVPREFGSVETVAGFAFAAAVLIVIPLFAAWSKKKWIAMGLAFYGIVPYLPIWFLPKITERISEGKASVISSMSGFLLKSIYGMVNAPFAPLSKYLGDDAASALSLWILPVSVCTYVMFQLVRFYRDAYVAEQLDPQSVVDTTAKENKRQQPDGSSGHRMREAKAPEVLGTVISAPVSDKRPAPAPAPAPAPKPEGEPKVRSTEPEVRIAPNKKPREIESPEAPILLGPPKTETEAKTASEDAPILLGPPRRHPGVIVPDDEIRE